MKRLLGALAVLACGLLASAAQVTITDNIQTVFGATVGGTITSVRIAWPAFTAADGTQVRAGNIDVPIPSGGAFSYRLNATVGSTPTVKYTFTMSSNTGGLKAFSVDVPATPDPVTFYGCAVVSPWLSWGLGLGPGTGGGGGGSGGGTSNGNATSIAGITLSTTAPTDGQGWLLNATSGQLEPVAIPYWKKYTVAYTQLITLPGTTGTVTLRSRGARQKICGVAMFSTIAFTAPSLSNITTTVGDSNATNNLYTPVAFSVADLGAKDYNVMGSATSFSNITATFNSTGANLSALTAGSVDIQICLVNLQ